MKKKKIFQIFSNFSLKICPVEYKSNKIETRKQVWETISAGGGRAALPASRRMTRSPLIDLYIIYIW